MRRISPEVDDVTCPDLKGRLPSPDPSVIRALAISSFIPEEADVVPQVHDFPWAYANVKRELWERCRVKPIGPFHDYDPYRLSSLLPKRKREKSLRSYLTFIRALSLAGELTFPVVYAFLLRSVNREVKITKREREFIDFVARYPSCKDKDLEEKVGMKRPTITRIRKKLKFLNYIHGPLLVNLGKLNLRTFLALVPNLRRFREAFWRFPFTYTQFIPVSSGVRSVALLSYPRDGVGGLARLMDSYGIKVYRIKSVVQSMKLNPEQEVVEVMLRSFMEPPFRVVEGREEKRVPPNSLDNVDLKIVNAILAEGKVPKGRLYRLSIDKLERRLRKLRELGVIFRYYTLQLPVGFEKVVLAIRCGEEEVGRLARVLHRVSSYMILWARREEEDICLAITMPPLESKGELVRILRSLYGDDLLIAEDFLDIQPGWRIPVRLWRPSISSFEWRDPLNKLEEELELAWEYFKGGKR